MIKFIFFVILTLNSFAKETYKYEGRAYDKKGKFLYKEVHEETWKNSKILTTKTLYLDEQNKELAILENDFSKSISFPEFTFKNHMTSHQHGISFQKNQYIMYKVDNDKKQSKVYEINPQSVTGQGFHFTLLQKLPDLKLKDKGTFDFVIPGRLTSYQFFYEVIKKDKIFTDIKVAIDNFWLRLIAPSMLLRYDHKKKRLLSYEGLSNIYAKQTVKIEYQHD